MLESMFCHKKLFWNYSGWPGQSLTKNTEGNNYSWTYWKKNIRSKVSFLHSFYNQNRRFFVGFFLFLMFTTTKNNNWLPHPLLISTHQRRSRSNSLTLLSEAITSFFWSVWSTTEALVKIYLLNLSLYLHPRCQNQKLFSLYILPSW